MIAFPLLAQILPATVGSAAQADGNGNFEQLLDTGKLPELKTLVPTAPLPDGEVEAEADTVTGEDVAIPVEAEETDTPDPLETVDRTVPQTASKSATPLQGTPEIELPQPKEIAQAAPLEGSGPLPVEVAPASPSERPEPVRKGVLEVASDKIVTAGPQLKVPEPAVTPQAQLEVAENPTKALPVDTAASAPQESVISAPTDLEINGLLDPAAPDNQTAPEPDKQTTPEKEIASSLPALAPSSDVELPETAVVEPVVNTDADVEVAILTSGQAAPLPATPQQNQPVPSEQTADLPPVMPALDVPQDRKAVDRDIQTSTNPEPRSASVKNPEVISVTRTGETVQVELAKTKNPVAGETFSQQLSKPQPEVSAPESGLAKVQSTGEPTTIVAPQPLRPVLAPVQPAPELQTAPAPQPTKSPIVRQVMEQLVQYPTEGGVATIRLKPHGMGVIEISVDRAKDGGLNVDMRVQNPLVLDAMRAERGAISHLFQPTGTTAGGTLSMDLFQSGAGTGREEQHRQNPPSESKTSSDTQADPEHAEDPALPLRSRQTRASGAVNILT
ncbi:hypothetical protein [Neptunicoccus cionae]|uniref:hypothetical protein n=1 Tax=Neptunicoccus cionae TaxID=2035344 RepID=UPI000C76D0FC|nr:hypothetical protein [Amylibacter cionae]PLS21132.1 hypothetical protein C0U40_13365 [Amylibacter cionae]